MSFSSEDRFLNVRISGETYGIPILRVREITWPVHTHRLVGSPEGVLGVFNWRDGVIPVIDVGTRLGLTSSVLGSEATGQNSRFVIVDYSGPGMKRCSDVMKCGKEGCPAYASDDRFCWAMAGTHCRGEIQGSYRIKIDACRECRFYLGARTEKQICQAALLVDEVDTVTTLTEASLDELKSQIAINTSLIEALARKDDQLVIVLNIDHLVRQETPQMEVA